mmetsp:Transcript_5228/g.14823  ORF Transcript_5228/g.14823 Transcript_5228/m.14823 type:complete len:219 (-) Transcript_5228:56-712(-)
MFAFGAAATNMPSPINGDGADTAAPSAAVVAEDSVTMSPLPGAAAIDATLDVPPAAAAASASAAPSGTGGATAASGTRATASLGEGTGNADAQLSASKANFYDLLCEKEGKSKGAKGAKYLTREEYDYATSVVTDWQPNYIIKGPLPTDTYRIDLLIDLLIDLSIDLPILITTIDLSSLINRSIYESINMSINRGHSFIPHRCQIPVDRPRSNDRSID